MQLDANNRHTVPVSDVARALNTDVLKGLTCREAELRLSEQGPNELEERGLKSPLRIMWDQFAAALVVILIIASVISFFIGETKDAAAILIIVLLNALLGFYQEHKAEKAMAALRALAVPGVRVRREGRVHEISARELVPGDIILLEAGNLVPADGRVSMSFNLRLQESALTGESATVTKESEETVSADVPPADRINMVYMGTVVAILVVPLNRYFEFLIIRGTASPGWLLVPLVAVALVTGLVFAFATGVGLSTLRRDS